MAITFEGIDYSAIDQSVYDRDWETQPFRKTSLLHC
jgi:hypothetical protein